MSDDAPKGEETLLKSVHGHLRAIAERQMAGERVGHSLQATALVNEAWLALSDQLGDIRTDPGKFYFAAAESMRRILIDHARRRNAAKRGGDMNRLSLDLAEVANTANLDQVLAIDEAISALEAVSSRGASVVRLRFFAGLDEKEVARTMNLSERTVRREWAFARAWLYRKLSGDLPPETNPETHPDASD